MSRPALLCLSLAVACTPALEPRPKSSGSIAVSNDDALLYVADADHDRLTLLDARTLSLLRHIELDPGPARIAVAPDGAVFVTSRDARAVTRLSRDGDVEARATVGAEPVGLAVDAKAGRLYVANSLAGTVSVLDARSLGLVAELPVGGNPYAVAVLSEHELAVTDFLGGRVATVSSHTGHVVRTHSLTQQSAGGCRQVQGAEREPAQAADLAVSPDGQRIYVAHVQSRTGPTWSGQGLAFAVAPAVSTVDVQSGETLQEPETDWFGEPPEVDFPATVLVTSTDAQCNFDGRGTGMDAPSSLVVDALGDWLFVADHNSNAVAVVSATRRSDARFASAERGIYGVVRVGARPTGIAVAADNRRAWVHNALDYSVSVVQLKGTGLVVTDEVVFADSGLPPDVEAGRKLFYSAVDPRVTEPELGGLSCSSCHPDGRTDGLSWSLDSSSRRLNTPPLWNLGATAPYAWNATLDDLPAFTTHMVSQMGGDGLTRLELADVTAYLMTLEPPDVGYRVDPALAARGEQVFAASCAGCHAGALLTDLERHVAGGPSIDTPSLVGVAATAPYLHDGTATTLREALRHPGAPSLGTNETAALEAWLLTR